MADMTLEEALAAATVDEELVTPVNEVLLINPETRKINIPESEKLFGVRQDMDAERKYFKCPKIVGDNIDLSKHKIFVNYVPSKQDGTYEPKEKVKSYWCEDLATDGDFVTFSWKLSVNVMRKAGYIAFAVYAKTIDEKGILKTKWHTTIAIGNVLETLPDGEVVEELYPDVIMQLLARMDNLESSEHSVLYVGQELTKEQQNQARKNIGAASSEEVSKLSEEIAKKVNPTDEQISEAVSGWLDEHPEATTTVVDGSITEEKLHPDLTEKFGASKPLLAEFPRLTNPARDIYNAFSMANKKTLGTDGTLRHNLMIHGALMTWTESTGSVDYADSSGSASVKLCGWYDKFGIGYKNENSNIIYTEVLDVFPHGSDIYGVDGTVIDTVVASSDSTIIDLGSNNYIIMAGCQGVSSYHMIYREVSYAKTITLGDTINVLTIDGAEWDMTTLREDYFNKYSQLNTKVIKDGSYYYMAIVQSGVGIAIMKSADGKEWMLNNHIEDTDCHLEACIGKVAWVSNNMPTVYVVVRQGYGNGYISLYAFKGFGGALVSKTFIPASTGRALLDSVNNKDIYLAYSVNGRNNAVLAQILPNSDGTSGVSILETPSITVIN